MPPMCPILPIRSSFSNSFSSWRKNLAFFCHVTELFLYVSQRPGPQAANSKRQDSRPRRVKEQRVQGPISLKKLLRGLINMLWKSMWTPSSKQSTNVLNHKSKGRSSNNGARSTQKLGGAEDTIMKSCKIRILQCRVGRTFGFSRWELST
jgi:hypothetical protein